MFVGSWYNWDMTDPTTFQQVTAEVKSRIDIIDFVGSYVSLKKSGKYFKACCPFHQEKTPSFVVSPEIGRWQCFGACHDGGDVISFLMKWENVPFSEALKILAERAQVKLTGNIKNIGFADAESDKRERMFEINSTTSRYYSYLLLNHLVASDAREYLQKRRLPHGLWEKFQLGYSPKSWDSLTKYLLKKSFTQEEIIDSGVGIKTSHGVIDRFRNRLMFPIFNTLGKIVGFSGRLIGVEPSEKNGGKYVNTSETLVYHKRESLYGFYFSKDAVRKANAVIVVEGEFDFLTPFSKGIENIVAIKGSAFTSEQLKVLRRYADRLILALDNDPAGEDALRRSIAEAVKFGFEIYVCKLPGGKDPDDVARDHLLELKNSISHPIPVFDHLFESLSKDIVLTDVYAKKKFTEQMAEYLLLADNPIVVSHYVQKIAELVSTSKDSVNEVIATVARKKVRAYKSPEDQTQDNLDTIPQKVKLQRELITGLLNIHDSEVVEKISNLLDGQDFDQIPYRPIFENWKRYVAGGKSIDVRAIIANTPQEVRSIAEELYLASSIIGIESKHYIKEVYRLALNLKKNSALEMLGGKNNTEASDDTLMTVNNMLKSVEKELQTL